MTGLDPRTELKRLPQAPGVYRLLDREGRVLYVGKARRLRSRVASYFRGGGERLTPRQAVMVAQTARIEFDVTRSESEALLLENNLIKTLRPRYNVQLRDDKSYPYIFVSQDHAFPRIGFHRGARRQKGRYFGPYPSASAVRQTLDLLSKLFQLRQCTDSFFRNRSRPCLQHQIGRCSAPCVGLIDAEHYREDLAHAILFLEGKTRTVQEEVVRRMEEAAARLDYETAARLRDRLAALRKIRERQAMVSGSGVEGGDADVLAAAVDGETAAVEVVSIRNGLNLGGQTFFPKPGAHAGPSELLGAFLPQYYLGRNIPPRLYLSHAVPDQTWLERVFSEQRGAPVVLSVARRGTARQWVELAQLNARAALERGRRDEESFERRLVALGAALGLENPPRRIECFDISHTFGEAPVAACVVFDSGGPVKSDYRRFNIEGVTPGDDYGALAQALTRRFRRLKAGEGVLPDLLLIDGGKGQLRRAEAVLREMGLAGQLRIAAVAKGPGRRPGRERLFLSGVSQAVILPSDSSALHLIQRIRDEAHRFAVTGHRQRRMRARTTSPLEAIPGVGDKRRQALLKHLGGLHEVLRADVETLANVPGISRALAQRIYDSLHEAEET